ncbi:hypothetical protein [Pseudonocardia asaccharolytica]|uniref:Uncharacterized protein n=1 Tax=Pseudonocardia asaccharolytica DSM 44247 = NBRC 16224 TaxID=1123024 RepID=A0A511D3L4_9PSEU|nr:hypothetical protein [Pseudonocardia asaccharolytica]GEL19370.1 hypothetical protein PA7_32070 [Pseudonocardia asaccharolytica DSM 44247 = NBRC 16224]
MTARDPQQWITDRQRVIATPKLGVSVRGRVVGYQPEQVIVELDDGGRAGFPVEQVSPLVDEQTQIEAQAVAALGGGTAGRDRLAALLDAGLQVVETSRPRLTRPDLRTQ